MHRSIRKDIYAKRGAIPYKFTTNFKCVTILSQKNKSERGPIPLKFAIVDTDRNLRTVISTAMGRAYPRAEVLQFQDGRAALQTLETQPIDALLCALILPELDGLGLLEAIRSMRRRPRVMVLTQVTNEQILARTLTLGADYYMIKPVEPTLVCRRLGELLGEKAEAPAPRDQPKDCVQMLSEMGVPARFAGYHYLLYGVELARRNPQYLNRLTTELYPLIAERFGKRAANVERGIRYAVDMAFSNNSRLTLADSLNVDECQVTQRLTNRAFITLLANAKRPE